MSKLIVMNISDIIDPQIPRIKSFFKLTTLYISMWPDVLSLTSGKQGR